MKATKGNKVYTIDETQKDFYVAQGYDISDEEGNLIEYGAGKSISYEKHKELQEKYEDLLDKCNMLEKENKKLKKEIEGSKKEIEGSK